MVIIIPCKQAISKSIRSIFLFLLQEQVNSDSSTLVLTQIFFEYQRLNPGQLSLSLQQAVSLETWQRTEDAADSYSWSKSDKQWRKNRKTIRCTKSWDILIFLQSKPMFGDFRQKKSLVAWNIWQQICSEKLFLSRDKNILSFVNKWQSAVSRQWFFLWHHLLLNL